MGQSIEQLSMAEINAHSSFRTEGERLCYVERLTSNSLQGMSRSMHEDIMDTMQSLDFDPFKQRFQAGSDETFIGYVAAYERCSGTTGFLLAVMNGEIELSFLELWDITEQGSSFRYIYPTEQSHIGLSGCFECGDRSILRYDVTARRFYWEYVGD